MEIRPVMCGAIELTAIRKSRRTLSKEKRPAMKAGFGEGGVEEWRWFSFTPLRKE